MSICIEPKNGARKREVENRAGVGGGSLDGGTKTGGTESWPCASDAAGQSVEGWGTIAYGGLKIVQLRKRHENEQDGNEWMALIEMDTTMKESEISAWWKGTLREILLRQI